MTVVVWPGGEKTMVRHVVVISRIVLLLVATVSSMTAAPPGLNSQPIDIGGRKQVFVDRQLIEASRNVVLTMHSPRRDGRVLISADQPWERDCHVAVYSSVLKDQGKVRVWYDLVKLTGPGPYDHLRMVAYAESEDGLHFVKPKLGLHAVDGSKQNNIVIPDKIGGCAVWIDPQAPARHRYKTQAKVYPTGEFHMHSSSDGLNWSLFSKPHPGPGGHDTQSIVYWDPAVKRYAMFTRFWAHHDDRDRRYRTVRRLETGDLKLGKWSNESIVMAPDARDRATHKTPGRQPPMDFYGACVFPYAEAPDVTIMLSQPHWHWQDRSPRKGLGPANLDVQLAVSRDGRQFMRLGQRRPFMANGRDGQFDSRYVWVLPNPVRMGDELWIYYAGNNRDHNGVIDPASPGGKQQSGIARAVLRLDGFVSADVGLDGGTLTTPPVRFRGDRLELNVETSGGGAVEVELLDTDGLPIAGFSRSEARAVNGNSVRMPVTWRGTGDVSQLVGTPIRLRFHMRDCRLYAFQFRPRLARTKSSGATP